MPDGTDYIVASHKEVEIPCPMKQFEEIVQNETGFTLVEHNLIMKGVCEDCKKK